jgi:hypothetical protein
MLRYIYLLQMKYLPITFYGYETQSVCLRDNNFIFQVHVALVLRPTYLYLFVLTPLANMYTLLIYAVLFLV